MIKDAINVLSESPLKYECPWCGATHVEEDWSGEEVIQSACCDVSKEEAEFPGTDTVQLMVRVREANPQ